MNVIYKDIIYRYGITWSIVIDNAKQFNNPRLKSICEKMKINKCTLTSYHSQANGQVEAANKTIKDNLKKKIEGLKGVWVDELPLVL